MIDRGCEEEENGKRGLMGRGPFGDKNVLKLGSYKSYTIWQLCHKPLA